MKIHSKKLHGLSALYFEKYVAPKMKNLDVANKMVQAGERMTSDQSKAFDKLSRESDLYVQMDKQVNQAVKLLEFLEGLQVDGKVMEMTTDELNELNTILQEEI